MSRKKTRCAGIVLLGVAAAAALLFFSRIGVWLAVSDPVPERIDVLFMFGGENARFSYSRSLMELFPQARWVLSDNLHQYSRILSREGFDMSRVTAFDTCRYTLSEIRTIAAWLHDNRDALVRAAAQDTASKTGAAAQVRVGLVSNPCHMRRIRHMARDVIRDTAFKCLCLPVPLERYGWTGNDLRHWWKKRTLRTWVASETAKLFWYWLFF